MKPPQQYPRINHTYICLSYESSSPLEWLIEALLVGLAAQIQVGVGSVTCLLTTTGSNGLRQILFVWKVRNTNKHSQPQVRPFILFLFEGNGGEMTFANTQR